ncbi:MAG: hypothetical protein QXK12_06605 [Candidatus Nezhaarchaeales archaeon]
MIKARKEHIEVAVGLLLLSLSVFASLLMAVNVITPRIILSFTIYSASLTGLVIGLHGVYGLIIPTKRRKTASP